MITIDARWINTSGIGTYLKNILPYVISEFPNYHFCLLGSISELNAFDWAQSPNVVIVSSKSGMYTFAEQVELIFKIPAESKLYWATHYNIPLLYRGKQLVTVYDIFHLAMPILVDGWHKFIYAKVMFNMVRFRASAILTISQFSRQEFIRLVGPVRHPVYPIHLGVAPAWFNIQTGLRPYENKYILFVGNVKAHKNLMALVESFESIYLSIPHDLVIVGKREGFITGDSGVVNAAVGLGARVYFTGYIDDQSVRQYVAHAEALVFPSLYEGFGLPPLEAMAAGCPVLVSDAGPMPEVCGDAALYCDPYNINDMAEKLLLILNDESLRSTLRQRGLEHAGNFTWDRCAEQTCEVIRGLLKTSDKKL